jgi:hypothetical protein
MTKPMRPKPRVRSRSKVKQALDREDSALVKSWWMDPANWRCCVPGCRNYANDRHHTRGKTRTLQNLARYWAPLCRPHHEIAHNDPKWAQAIIIFKGTPREMPLLASGRDWMTTPKNHAA